MRDKRSRIDPGKADDDSDRELDAVLTAADEGMLTTITESLNLDAGFAQITGLRATSTAAAAGQAAGRPRGRTPETPQQPIPSGPGNPQWAVPPPGNAGPGNSHRRGLRAHGCSFRDMRQARARYRGDPQFHGEHEHGPSRDRLRVGCRHRLCCSAMGTTAGKSRSAISRLPASGIRRHDPAPVVVPGADVLTPSISRYSCNQNWAICAHYSCAGKQI
jgi:hypothetical protein